jgi:PAS domain S-box-containing protein
MKHNRETYRERHSCPKNNFITRAEKNSAILFYRFTQNFKEKMNNKTSDMWDKRLFRDIICTMADGVFTLNSDGRITLWNKSMEQISGYTSEEAMGNTCELLNCTRCHGRQCPISIHKCGVLEDKSPGAQECFIRHKEGYDIPVIKNAKAVRDENGNVIGVVETITDLTELEKTRHKADEAFRRLGEMHRLNNIIGKSDAMRTVFATINAAAASDATILIHGESGTGKELVAGSIHYNSNRAKNPLVTVNCSALSESLLESELFGHIKGSFTGAARDRIGRLEESDGGTIFLDEIGELSPVIQVKLLRVLQEREIERVGESKKRKIDIRVIAATHRDLYARVKNGQFREDLYYRLKVFPIRVPPLRDRKEDIPLLVRHFIDRLNKKTGKQIKGLSSSAMHKFMDYNWPGNVRELENAIEHAFVLCNADSVSLSHLPIEIREMNNRYIQSPAPVPAYEDSHAWKNLTREMLMDLLHECQWNKAEVARRLKISRTAVWKRMKQWDIPLQQ